MSKIPPKAKAKKIQKADIQKVDVEFVLSVVDARGYTRDPSVQSFVSALLEKIQKLYAHR